jgi:hypothetical protein
MIAQLGASSRVAIGLQSRSVSLVCLADPQSTIDRQFHQRTRAAAGEGPIHFSAQLCDQRADQLLPAAGNRLDRRSSIIAHLAGQSSADHVELNRDLPRGALRRSSTITSPMRQQFWAGSMMSIDLSARRTSRSASVALEKALQIRAT